MGWPKGRKRGPQTPAHRARAVAARAKAVEGRVWVSRNDANMLELSRQLYGLTKQAQDKIDTAIPAGHGRHLQDPIKSELEAINAQAQQIIAIGQAWLNGEDVLIAKLSQE